MRNEIEKKIIINMIQDFCFVKEEDLITAEGGQHLDAHKELKEHVQKENEEESESTITPSEA
jgi:hypothetical protein